MMYPDDAIVSITVVAYLLAIVVLALFFYWMYRTFVGQNTSVLNPVESNVDRYLDMRFEKLIDEWGLVTGSRLKGFKNQVNPRMNGDVERVEKLKDYRSKLNKKLDGLDKKVTALEK